MAEIIKNLAEAPVASILIVAGIVFLMLSVAGAIGNKISVDEKKQHLAGIIGSILLILGISSSLTKYILSFQLKNIGLSDHSNTENSPTKQTSSYGYFENNRFVITQLPLTPKQTLNLNKLPTLKQGFHFDISKLTEQEQLIFQGIKTPYPIFKRLSSLEPSLSLNNINCEEKPFKPLNLGEGSFHSKMSSADYHFKQYIKNKRFYHCDQMLKYRALALCTFPNENDAKYLEAHIKLNTELQICKNH